MAEYDWLGTTDTDPAVAANFDPGSGPPGVGDDVDFDGDGDNPCTLTDDWSLASLTSVVGYNSKLDLGDSAFTLAISGNLILDQADEFDCGDATIEVGGDFDNKDVGTWTLGTSTVVMNGTGNLTSSTTKDLYNLTISPGAVITLTTALDINSAAVAAINGTLSIDNAQSFRNVGGITTIGSAGKITGLGTYHVFVPGAGKGITSFAAGGIIDVALLIIDRPGAATILAPGTYASALVRVEKTTEAQTLTLSNGDYVFGGDLEFKSTGANSLTVANDTNDPSIELQGDLIWTDTAAGTITWTPGTSDIVLSGLADQNIDGGDETFEDIEIDKPTAGDVTLVDLTTELQAIDMGAGDLTITGSTITSSADAKNFGGNVDWSDAGNSITWGAGTITFSGGNAQAVDLKDATVKAIVVNKSAGTLTFGDGWTAASYTQQAGTVDFNGETFVTDGAWSMTAGAASDMAAADITVGGDFLADGVDLIGAAGWTLAVTGTATMSNLTVTNCDASGGSEVSAIDCTNGGGNTNIRFTTSSPGLTMRAWGSGPEPMIPY